MGGDDRVRAAPPRVGGRRVRLPGSSWGSPLDRDLPRGRHGFPLDQVGMYQRVRLLDAFVAEVGRVGYPAARVAAVCSRAGASTKAFYARFRSKEGCLLQAFDAGAKVLCDHGGLAYRQAVGPWQDRATAGITAMLAILADNPPFARLALVELGRLGPTGQARLDAVAAYCCRQLEARPSVAVPAPLSAEEYRDGLVAAAVRVLGELVLSGRTADLADLSGMLGDWLAAWPATE